MKIIADKEGRLAIEQLCNIALKVAGIENLSAVNKILAAIHEQNDVSDKPQKQ